MGKGSEAMWSLLDDTLVETRRKGGDEGLLVCCHDIVYKDRRDHGPDPHKKGGSRVYHGKGCHGCDPPDVSFGEIHLWMIGTSIDLFDITCPALINQIAAHVF